jgi:hypothetical protein
LEPVAASRSFAESRLLGSQTPVPLNRNLATWRSGYAAACKAVYTGSIPVVASYENSLQIGMFSARGA